MVFHKNDYFAFENATVTADFYSPGASLGTKWNCKTEIFPGFKRVTVCNKRIWSIAEMCRERVHVSRYDDSDFLDFKSEDSKSHLDVISRARRKLFDLIALNSWDWFVTLTLDKSKIVRGDVKAFSSKLNVYLRNLVQRQGISYILVPELHKDGAYHAHALISGDLPVVDSGTVTWKGNKRPVKRSTALKRFIPDDELITVYNVPSWKYGFTTAIRTYGKGDKLAAYVGKYLTKDSVKIFGRRYWHSKNIRQYPDVVYSSCEFINAKGVEYVNEYSGERYRIITIYE